MSPVLFKTLVFAFMILIVFNLFRGLYFLVTGKGEGRATVRALGWRIGLSMALFFLLIILKVTGLVEPHSLNNIPAKTTAIEVEGKETEGHTLKEIQHTQSQDGRIRLKQQ